jgi:hypothetical protein
LLISNVLVYFRVLLCCRSLSKRRGLKGIIKLRCVKSLLVCSITLTSAIERNCDHTSRVKNERSCTLTQEVAIECLSDRAYDQRSSALHVDYVSRVTLAAIANLLCHGIPERLPAIDPIPHDRVLYDRA